MRYIITALTLLLVLPFQAMAEEGNGNHWSGETDIGYVKKTGNTESETLTARQKLVYEADRWVNTLVLNASNTESGERRTGERYYVTDQLDYFITEKTYAFGRGSWEKDRFTGFDYQSTWVLGFGRKLFNTDSFTLTGELGAGQSIDKIRHKPPEVEGDRDTDAMLYFSEDLSWAFSQTAELGQELTVERSSKQTISRFDIYLRSALVGNVSMRVAYSLRHNTDVPENIKRTDETVTVSLNYRF